MKKVLHWLSLVRSINLLMMMLIIWLVNQWLVAPFISAAGIETSFDVLTYILLNISVLATAAAGNIINDISDVETDRINRPKKLIINVSISENQAQRVYWFMLIISIISALLLSIYKESIYFLLITATFNGLLWFYAKRYKQQFLVGNLVIAFLSAGLIFYVWLFDLLVIIKDPITNARMEPLLGMMAQVIFIYAAFAFLSSLIREVIKDMEDMKGDFKTGSRTLAIVIGESHTTRIVQVLMLLLLALLVWWQIILFKNAALAAFGFLFLTDSLLLITALQLNNQTDVYRFSKSAVLMKLIMLTGIISIAFIQL